MCMFWTFKLGFVADTVAFFGHFFQYLGKILIYFLVTLEPRQAQREATHVGPSGFWLF
jgi:hypothetical protein